MTVTSFEYEDRRRRWKLERTLFAEVNLLVGLSGVGKTLIINALRNVRNAGRSRRLPGIESEWRIELRSEDQTYIWEAATVAREGAALPEDDESSVTRAASFERERIVTGDGEVLVERTPDRFLFLGEKLPKLENAESAISLLKAEDSMTPLYRALQRMLFSHADASFGIMFVPESALEREEVIAATSFESLRGIMDVPILIKAYFAQRHYSDIFARIREQYMTIFPSVTDVCVGRLLDLDPRERQDVGHDSPYWDKELMTVAIKEEGVDSWIVARYISSGMLRTFLHLAELELAPPGTVVIIDEYENSMGMNCLPAVTDHFLHRQSDLQFILTSHHPYVINNIPVSWWRLVRRRGGIIRVRNASELPEFNTRSRQDAFTLLTNSPVYEEGIQ